MNGHPVRQPGGVVLAREMDWCSSFSAASGRKLTVTSDRFRAAIQLA